MFSLLYDSGLRRAELLKLRVKDDDFEAKTVFVFRGKGGKDRTTMLPKKLIEPLTAQVEKVRGIGHNRVFGRSALKCRFGLLPAVAVLGE